jgi:hypothetical protein
MNTSAKKLERPLVVDVDVSRDTLTARLADGRSISVPLEWYPRLAAGTASERSHWKLIATGHGIHWPDLDEDISVDALLSGRRSEETPSSLKKWLSTRARGA